MNIDDYYNNATEKERREMDEGCGIGCLENFVATAGVILIIIVAAIFLFLCAFAEYDDAGNFLKWSWQ